jgi:hypothetical protein
MRQNAWLSSTNHVVVLLNSLTPRTEMLLSKASFNDNKVLPFIVKKEDEYTEEGSYSLHLFSRTVITKEGKKYRYLPLRFEGELARFRKRSEAEDYARYRLALD